MIATTWRLPDAPLRSSAVATKLTALLASSSSRRPRGPVCR